MKRLIIILIYFLMAYLISFIFYAFIINRKRKGKIKINTEMDYIIKKFNLDTKKLNLNKLRWIMNIINPLIISITFIIIMFIDSFVLGIIVAFVIMIALIYSIYEIIGRTLKKQQDKNN